MLVVLGVLSGHPAFAHNYLPAAQNGGVTTIADIDVSRAAYRVLGSASQVDVYEFTATKGQELYIQVTVPLLDRERGFSPGIVLLSTDTNGPSFVSPVIDKGTLIDPPHDVVDSVLPHQGDGADAEPPLLGATWDASEPVVFDEPFTGTRYWTRQTLTVKAPEDGTYRIGVYSADGATGKYVLATGQKEKFGPGDILSFPGVRLTVRSFCEVPVWPDVLAWTVLGASLLVGVGLGVYALLAF